VEGDDWDTVLLQTDPTFWHLIRRRRKQSTVSLSQVRAKLRVGK
jgi:hypothetical protein